MYRQRARPAPLTIHTVTNAHSVRVRSSFPNQQAQSRTSLCWQRLAPMARNSPRTGDCVCRRFHPRQLHPTSAWRHRNTRLTLRNTPCLNARPTPLPPTTSPQANQPGMARQPRVLRPCWIISRTCTKSQLAAPLHPSHAEPSCTVPPVGSAFTLSCRMNGNLRGGDDGSHGFGRETHTQPPSPSR